MLSVRREIQQAVLSSNFDPSSLEPSLRHREVNQNYSLPGSTTATSYRAGACRKQIFWASDQSPVAPSSPSAMSSASGDLLPSFSPSNVHKLASLSSEITLGPARSQTSPVSDGESPDVYRISRPLSNLQLLQAQLPLRLLPRSSSSPSLRDPSQSSFGRSSI